MLWLQVGRRSGRALGGVVPACALVEQTDGRRCRSKFRTEEVHGQALLHFAVPTDLGRNTLKCEFDLSTGKSFTLHKAILGLKKDDDSGG